MLNRIATFLLLLSATIVWQPIAVAAPHCAGGDASMSMSGMAGMAGNMSGHDHQAMMAAQRSDSEQTMLCQCDDCECDTACISISTFSAASQNAQASWQPAHFTRAFHPTIHAKAQAPLPYRPPIA